MSDNICPKCNNVIDKGSKFCPTCGFSLEYKKNDVDEIKSNFLNFKNDITSKIQNKLENEDMLNANEIKDMIKNLDEDSLKQLMEKYGISPGRFKLLNFKKLFDKVDIYRLKDDLINLGIIIPKSDSDVQTVKDEVSDIEKDFEEEPQPQENEVPLIENDNINTENGEETGGKEQELQNDEPTVSFEEEVNEKSQEYKETVVEEEKDVIAGEDSQGNNESESLEDDPAIDEENDATEEMHSDNSNICSECGFENRPNVKFCTKCGNKLIRTS